MSRSVVGGGGVVGSGLGDSYGAGSPHPDGREGSVLPEDLATQSVRLKEEQLRREGEYSRPLTTRLSRETRKPAESRNCTFTTEEKLRDLELRSQRELAEKRQELLAKEESLRNLEARLAAHNHHQLNGSQSSSIAPSPIPQQGPPVPLHDGGAANGH